MCICICNTLGKRELLPSCCGKKYHRSRHVMQVLRNSDTTFVHRKPSVLTSHRRGKVRNRLEHEIRTHARTNTCTHLLTHTYLHTIIHTYSHTLSCTCTRTHMDTYIRTHKWAPSQVQCSSCSAASITP